VRFVEDDDPDYMSGIPISHRPAYVKSGICKFQTCPRVMHIPVSYIIARVEEQYDENAIIPNSKFAIYHWWTASILDAIGSHNIV
jgi:hypothetical protein